MSSVPFDLTPEALRAESAALRGLSRALLGHEQDAEDAEQDTWLAALQNPPAHTGEQSAWLARVAKNFALRIRRKHDARKRWERESAKPEALPSTLEAIERVAMHEQIVHAVLVLDEPYRSTIVLRFWEDRPPRDIARVMKVPVSTVRTRTRRALEVLRDRLDRSFGNRAAWTGVLALGTEKATAIGSTTVPAAGIALLGVALMTTKVKLLAATIAAVAVIWTSSAIMRNPELSRTPEVNQAIALTVPASDLTIKESAPAQRERVDRVEPNVTAKEELDQTPSLVEPYEVWVRVLDARGLPVAGATVEVWDGEKAEPNPSFPSKYTTYSTERLGSEPFLRKVSDQTGRCTLDLDREMVYLHAFKAGFGESGDRSCFYQVAKRGKEVILSLAPGIGLRGQVIGADSLPAADVEVRLRASTGSGDRVRSPEPIKADWEGRFEFRLRPGTSYTIEARDGRKRALAKVSTFTLEDQEVVVRFPGTQSIRGFLFDPAGLPVADGQIHLWEVVDEEELSDNPDPLTKSTKTKQDGSFRFDLTEEGIYHILGSAMGLANTALTDVEVTELQPHAESSLSLMPARTIAGTALHENGDPIVGALMFLSAEQGPNHFYSALPKRHDLYGRIEPVTTAIDGSFMFLGVHPNTTYKVTCRPNPQNEYLRASQHGVAPGNQDVLMALTDLELEGSSISGMVVADDTGEPIEAFSMRRVYYQEDGTIRTSSECDAEIDPGRYSLSGLSLGEVYGFIISSKTHAPQLVGPLTTTRSSHVLNVRLGNFGRVECRVVDLEGLPIVDALVMIVPVVRIPTRGGRLPSPTDADGLRPFSKLSPGKYEIYPIRKQQRLESKFVEVFANQTTEVEFRIAR